MGVRNTNVFGTAGELYEIRMNTSGYFAPLPCAALALTPNPGTPEPPAPEGGSLPLRWERGACPRTTPLPTMCREVSVFLFRRSALDIDGLQ